MSPHTVRSGRRRRQDDICDQYKVTVWCPGDCYTSSIGEHRSKHCADDLEDAEFDLCVNALFRRTGLDNTIMRSEHPSRSYTPLRTLTSWQDYFSLVQNPLASSITADNSPASRDKTCLEQWRKIKNATDSTTFILTHLAGFETTINGTMVRSLLRCS